MPLHTPAWPIRTIGRRGVFLVMFGVIYLAVGISVLNLNTRRFSDISPVVGPLLDAPLWGWLWVGAGVLGIYSAIRRTWHVPDGLGFGALLIPPAAWTIFYAASFVAYVATSGEFGRVNAFSGMAVWAIVWFVILLVSGWPEAERRRPGDTPPPPGLPKVVRPAEPPADEER